MLLVRSAIFGSLVCLLSMGLSNWAHAQSNNPLDLKSKGLAHYMMGVLHDFNGEPQQAFNEYQASSKLNGNQPALHLRLGAHYARFGHLPEAETELKKVVALDPGNLQAQYLLSLVYSSEKKFDEAANSYEQILKNAAEGNPKNADILMYLAQLYYTQRQYPKAIDQLEQILVLHPNHLNAMSLLGSIYLDLNKHNDAIVLLKKVLTIDHDNDNALNSLAYLYAEQGINLDQALKMARRAIELDPTNGAYYDSLGWVLFHKGQYAEALMALQKAETYVTDPIIFEHMGDVYDAVNEESLARKFWRKSLQMDPHQSALNSKLQAAGRK